MFNIIKNINFKYYILIIILILIFAQNISAFVDNNNHDDNIILLYENFDDTIFPPYNWSINLSNDNYSWDFGFFNKFNGIHSAECINDPLNTSQNEWLISPNLDFRGYSKISLFFHWSMSYFWAISPYDNYDFNIKISIDNGVSWNLEWCEKRVGKFEDWVWYNSSSNKAIDLSKYKECGNVLIGFQYIGSGGAQLNIDEIKLFGEQIDDPPIVDIICPNEAFTGESIQFISNVSGGKRPYLYHWYFEDGDKKYLMNPVKIFEKTGEFKVFLNITDISQNKGFAQKTISIYNKSKKPQLIIQNVSASNKIEATIANLGNDRAFNVTWNIKIFNRIKLNEIISNGTFNCINCSCSKNILSNTFNGLGLFNVEISAFAENAEKVTKEGFGLIIDSNMIFLFLF